MEQNQKQVYLTPDTKVKTVAVENGFGISNFATEAITNGGTIVSF